jgi:hypothetical protein
MNDVAFCCSDDDRSKQMPASQTTTTDPTPGEIEAILAPHTGREGPLLPMLHALQEVYGHVPAAAHAPICAALNITRAELHGVISFYHDFRERPPGATCSRSAALRPVRPSAPTPVGAGPDHAGRGLGRDDARWPRHG